ncbi:hypothetical protein LTR36_004944 [Oleoguttula mirabilis]|uniref:Uncharacterized protein n=1 Tax=Oleoguttula mirabilis TaxID=1507867 RepID=A0AAV9JX01_9PEZI|nr:hypothetical protein LTR36_004944 [Oleoguttula mirabilis]
MARKHCTSPKLTVPRANGSFSTVHQRNMSERTPNQTPASPRSDGEGATRPQAKLDEKTCILVDKMAKRAAVRGASRPRPAEEYEGTGAMIQIPPAVRQLKQADVDIGSIARATEKTKSSAMAAQVSPSITVSKHAATGAGSGMKVAEMVKAKAVQLSPGKAVLRNVKAGEDAWEMVEEGALEEEQWVTDGF